MHHTSGMVLTVFVEVHPLCHSDPPVSHNKFSLCTNASFSWWQQSTIYLGEKKPYKRKNNRKSIVVAVAVGTEATNNTHHVLFYHLVRCSLLTAWDKPRDWDPGFHTIINLWLLWLLPNVNMPRRDPKSQLRSSHTPSCSYCVATTHPSMKTRINYPCKNINSEWCLLICCQVDRKWPNSTSKDRFSETLRKIQLT